VKTSTTYNRELSSSLISTSKEFLTSETLEKGKGSWYCGSAWTNKGLVLVHRTTKEKRKVIFTSEKN
jgi:hypothetical protein